MAKSLIDAAADAGADAVKFQTFKADQLATPAAAKADYEKNSGDSGELQQAMLCKLELSEQAHLDLISHCQMRGIRFLSTAFDPESTRFLDSLALPYVKTRREKSPICRI